LGEKGQKAERRGQRIECRRQNFKCGLRPLQAVGTIYEPEAVGAIGAHTPRREWGISEGGIGNAAFGKKR